MRFDGRLAQWDDARGFGFIEPTQGGARVFVHIRAFGPAHRAPGQRPRVGEHLEFEVGTDARGRKQAHHVMRTGGVARPAVQPSRRRPQGLAGSRLPGGLAGLLLTLALITGLGWKGYQWWAAHAPGRGPAASFSAAASPEAGRAGVVSSAAFRCDGRQYCSQMTSCAEATFFLRNCPDVRMDGNGDGIPCERQWCTSPLAR